MARHASVKPGELSASEIGVLWRRHVPNDEGELTYSRACELWQHISSKDAPGAPKLTEEALQRCCHAVGLEEGGSLSRAQFLSRFNAFWTARSSLFGTSVARAQRPDLGAELRQAHALATSEAAALKSCEVALQTERHRVLQLQGELASQVILRADGRNGDPRQLTAELAEAQKLRQEAALAADQALVLRRRALLEEEQVSDSLMNTRIASEQAVHIRGCLTAELRKAEGESQMATEDKMLCAAAEDKVAMMRSKLRDEYLSAQTQIQRASHERMQGIAEARDATNKQRETRRENIELLQEVADMKNELGSMQILQREVKELQKERERRSAAFGPAASCSIGTSSACGVQRRQNELRAGDIHNLQLQHVEEAEIERLRQALSLQEERTASAEEVRTENQRLRRELRDLSAMARWVPRLEDTQQQQEVLSLRMRLAEEEKLSASLRRERDRLLMELKDLSSSLSQPALRR